MSRQPNPLTVARWQDRFARFLDSNLTVAAFCQAERVSQPAFYYWKKRLASEKSPKPIPTSNVKATGNSARKPVSRPVIKSAAASSAFATVQLFERSTVTPTIIRIGSEIEIELGSDVSTVDLIATKLMRVFLTPSRLEENHTTTRIRSIEARRA